MLHNVSHTTYFHLLSEVGEHDYGEHIVIPDEPPEVFHCVWKRALRCNVLLTPVVALQPYQQSGKGLAKTVSAHVYEVGIDVVVFLSFNWF